MTVGIGPGMPVNNSRNQGVGSTEVIENYGRITCGARNFGKIADSVIRRSLVISIFVYGRALRVALNMVDGFFSAPFK